MFTFKYLAFIFEHKQVCKICFYWPQTKPVMAHVFCLSLRHPLSRCYCDPGIEGAEADPDQKWCRHRSLLCADSQIVRQTMCVLLGCFVMKRIFNIDIVGYIWFLQILIRTRHIKIIIFLVEKINCQNHNNCPVLNLWRDIIHYFP